MDIAGKMHQVFVIFYEKAFEAPLKKMPRTAVPCREPVGISRQQILHSSGKVGLWSAEEKVNVIRHTDVTEDLEVELVDRDFEAFE